MDAYYDVVVLGGGPGGYTAALYCARAGLRTLVLEKLSPGGQMATTEQIDNYPGFDEGVDGLSWANGCSAAPSVLGPRLNLQRRPAWNLLHSPSASTLPPVPWKPAP